MHATAFSPPCAHDTQDSTGIVYRAQLSKRDSTGMANGELSLA